MWLMPGYREVLSVRWLPLTLGVLSSLALGEATAQPGEGAASGRWVAWDALEDVAASVSETRTEAKGTHVALRIRGVDTSGIEVWTLSESGQVARQAMARTPGGSNVLDFAWCGDLLVYVLTQGLERLDDIRRLLDDEAAVLGFLRSHTRTITCEPGSPSPPGERDGGCLQLIGEAGAGLLACVDPLRELTSLREPAGRRVAVYQLPEWRLVRRYRTALPLPESGSQVISWDSRTDGWYVLEPRHAAEPGDKGDYAVLLYTDAASAQRELSNRTDCRLLSVYPHCCPTITRLEDGSGVIGFVLRQGGVDGIAVFGSAGVTKRYDFGPRALYPAKLRDTAKHWAPVSCSPDARVALFQQAPEVAGEQGWVYAWDLASEEARPLARMGRITRCFEWIGSRGVVVRAAQRDPGGQPTLGVLWLEPPTEQGESKPVPAPRPGV